MSADEQTRNGSSVPTGAELGRMVDAGQWDKVKELLTPSLEEVERILQEPMIDGEEVNRMLGITEEELAAASMRADH